MGASSLGMGPNIRKSAEYSIPKFTFLCKDTYKKVVISTCTESQLRFSADDLPVYVIVLITAAINKQDDNWQTGGYNKRDQSPIFFKFILMQHLQTIF